VERLKNINMLLHPLIRIPSLKLSAVNGFALLLLLLICILGIAFLVGNALFTINEFAKHPVENAIQGATGKKVRIPPSQNLLTGIIFLPCLAFLITKGVAETLQGPQSVMALMLVFIPS
jgi:hypothetical protein